MDFTFGVLTYNSEETIIETMESIKFQILNYGDGLDVFLVIADDFSRDRTIKVIKSWLDKNEKLFMKITILEAKENLGVCRNYSKMIREIKTKDFLQIAGDDVISSQNIFAKIHDVKENELKVFMQYDLLDGSLKVEDYYIARQLYYNKKKHNNRIDKQLLETFPPYRSIEIVFQRHHYTEDCMNYIEQYKNFEDDTSLYYIFMHNTDVHFTFSMEPLILYRRSHVALTQSVDNVAQIKFLDDLYKFRKETFKNEKNVIIKLILLLSLFHSFLHVHRFDARNSIFKKLVIRNQNKILRKMSKNPEYLSLRKDCMDFIMSENTYLNHIKEQATLFMNEIL